jgi:poly(3-hydroxybutyrate) depolymerase
VVDTEQKHFLVEGAGHYGIFSGRRWRDMVYPEVKAFIRSHQPVAQAAGASQPDAPAEEQAATANEPAARKVARKKQ